jgi:ketosteroid isomerase-like protein
MLDRERAVATVDALWAARVNNDIGGITAIFTEDFSLRIACDEAPFEILSGQDREPMTLLERLIAHFRFLSTKRLTTVFEGNRLAVLWDMTLEAKGHDEIVQSQMLDLYEFDENGRISAMVQFVDTAKMLALLQ